MEKTKVIVGLGSCGIAAGAFKTYQKIESILNADKLDFELKKTSCIGMCFREPLVEIIDRNGSYIYGNVDENRISEIIEKHIKNDEPIKEYVVATKLFETEDNKFFDAQVKIALRHCGTIDPESITEYESQLGYEAIKKIAKEKITYEAVIQSILDSGIRGRGGGGFSTGMKWKFARNNKSDEKYIICNADEGDPGAFMNRSLLEGDPHSVLEGMAIGAYAIGANHGYIYCRAEYPLALERLRLALQQMERYGFIGDNILGSGFDFHIKIKEGAGAFVCGEETALIASIEGKRGMPRARPPFPAISGLWGKPTNINNVETWANAARILQKGSEWYAQYGSEKSKGTKTFALVGKVERTGLIEVPLGITLRQIIYEIGGGILKGKEFKAVQTGGPSGGCLPSSMLDSPVDYESLAAAGSIMGSGGMIVADEETCMVDLTKYFLAFTQAESCGKCPPCRVGTRQMLGILERITQGEGKPGDIEQLERIAITVKQGSL